MNTLRPTLFLTLFLLWTGWAMAASPQPAAATPSAPHAPLVDFMVNKWPPSEYQAFFTPNDCFDAKSDLSLPYALTVRQDLVTAMKKAGYIVLEHSVASKKAVVLQCRWSQEADSTIQLTFQLTPWVDNKRGKVYVQGITVPASNVDPKLFQPDMATWSRTLMHRLERKTNLTPQKVYLRPFKVGEDVGTHEVNDFFNDWMVSSIKESSIFEPVEGKKDLYGIEPGKLKMRAIRPRSEEESLSLTANLLEAKSEISGKIALPNSGEPQATEEEKTYKTRSIRPVNKKPGETAAATPPAGASVAAPAKGGSDSLKVQVALAGEGGKALSDASVDIPVVDLPPDVQKRLSASAAPVTRLGAASGAGPMLELTTTRGEGATTYKGGEKIRFLIRMGEPSYLYLFDIDGADGATLLFPAMGTKPEKMEPGKLLVLPDDRLPYELEVQPPFGEETIWAVASREPLKVPEELTGDWARGTVMMQKVRDLALKSGKGFSEARVFLKTVP